MLRIEDLYPDQDSEWSNRSEYWIAETARRAKPRKKRERRSEPLILCGHGMSIRIENGVLLIRDGFTHYPQKQVIHRLFPGALDIPPRILLLDGSGTLSFDVLSWLGEQNVALARIKSSGEVAVAASGAGYAADRRKVRWQEQTRNNELKRTAFAIDLITRKLTNSIGTLTTCMPPSAYRETAIDKATELQTRLAVTQSIDGIRAIEGECAAAYFAAWQHIALNWKATKRYPIPDDWRTYRARSSLTTGVKPKNRNASHPINAMLNYAYTVKLAQLQIKAIADGYDPTIGIMHHEGRNKPAYALDLIEPERPKVDALLLRFIQSMTFSGADFIIRPDGACRLSPQLAKMVATLAA